MPEITAVTKEKLKLVFIISFVGALFGIICVTAAIGYSPARIVRGAIGGFVITAIISATEIYYFSETFKRTHFLKIISIRTIYYLFVISFIILLLIFISDSMEYDRNILSAVSDEYLFYFFENVFLPILIFSLFASLLINFILQINNLLGWGVLLNAMIGRYKKPGSARKVFMFLDISSSTKIGEKLGEEKYSNLLQDFFDDLDKTVIESGGEIYQYVGDEVVVTWNSKKDENNLKCLLCFFNFQDRIKEKEKYYKKCYGLIPDFKAGIHLGNVTEAEVGDLQKEIVYHGDVLNTASRIELACTRLRKKLLVSKEFLTSVKMNGDFKVEKIGKIKLRGKKNNPELFSIEKKQNNLLK
jgi:adenylate cyclase